MFEPKATPLQTLSPKVDNVRDDDELHRDTTTTYLTGDRPRNENGLVVGRWEAPVFGCLTDVVPNCLLAFFCPCVSMAQTMARLGVASYYPMLLGLALCYGTGVGAALAWLLMWFLRYKLRTRLSIPGSVATDGLLTFCCCGCALAQMATQTHSYERNTCSIAPKATLVGYSDLLTHHDATHHPMTPPRPFAHASSAPQLEEPAPTTPPKKVFKDPPPPGMHYDT
ncbi:hypothetical protein SPRG_11189 [Saprolegnia parasitica CBS 223.65]|uniref:PLAC8 family protein n=1 Tax=Saprolegnia parasitica (strain CBS 223.65) TaxID=695850 RepID=A0A067BXM4_SAPPC|nr:hypothetical protein SPRG_11189 [Saprolegnia parasitica CBS 223.65]KDO23259.1 hypothetical protein SPRG_11189 [Saprolegnia parasitica CBS 223.65]|eukprot:XP_012206047.1 hypothetical protein SPRG_11189 [Saprolegnia parasitica CBS 223.65]